jgi:hypothetical protein
LPLVAFCLLAAAGGIAQESAPRVNSGVPTFGTTVVVPGGLRGDVYKIPPRSLQLPNFRKLKPVGSIYTAELNVPPRDFTEGFPGVTDRDEWFAIDYTGRFWVNKPGVYRFSLSSDDGSKLYIDDIVVIDNDGIHATWTEKRDAPLSFGIHRIRVSYFQGPRYRLSLILKVAPPGGDWRVFNTNEFRPPPDPEDWDTTAALNTQPAPHDFEFHAAALHFRSGPERWHGSIVLAVPGAARNIHLSLLALLKDASGNVADSYRLSASNEDPGQPMVFTHPFELAAGAYTLEAAAVDRDGKRASTSTVNITSPAPQPGIAMSSVVLARLGDPVTDSPDDPLVYQGRRVVPLLNPAIRQNDKFALFFVVYPDHGATEKPRVRVEFTLDGRPLPERALDAPAPDASGGIPFLIDAESRPGTYEWRVTAAQGRDSATETGRYTVAR